jgi:hypothetical protein
MDGYGVWDVIHFLGICSFAPPHYHDLFLRSFAEWRWMVFQKGLAPIYLSAMAKGRMSQELAFHEFRKYASKIFNNTVVRTHYPIYVVSHLRQMVSIYLFPSGNGRSLFSVSI